MQRHRNIAEFGQRDLAALGALALAVIGLGGVLLWAGYGEGVYIDRIFSAIANCF